MRTLYWLCITIAVAFNVAGVSAQAPPATFHSECYGQPLKHGQTMLCVDVRGPSVDLMQRRPKWEGGEPDRQTVLSPNRELVVFVISDNALEATLTVAYALVMPGTSQQLPTSPANALAPLAPAIGALGLAPAAPDAIRATFVFPPPSGTGTLTIKKKMGPGVPDDVRTVTFLIETEYAVAFRFGIGLAWSRSGPDETYKRAVRSGSETGEVVRTSQSPVAVELVVGIAPFVFDRWICHRYRPQVHLNDRGCHQFAPYLGFGALSVDKDKIEALSSLYVGLEWELTPAFTVVVAYMARRVSMLREELQIGSAVDAGETEITSKKVAQGLGFVFNVGPEFFKFAAEATKK